MGVVWKSRAHGDDTDEPSRHLSVMNDDEKGEKTSMDTVDVLPYLTLSYLVI